MLEKLLAAHIATVVVCVVAAATPLDAHSFSTSGPYACGTVYGAGPISDPAVMNCMEPSREYGGMSVLAALDVNNSMGDMSVIEATRVAPRVTGDESDVWLISFCGMIFLALGSLRVGVGRKRHRDGARKSTLEFRMMA